ncbi:hypothetical protein HGA64_02730 [Candidatus Falkowbacteria bacterium]|nr:hypothetical protein [Candidatus Falkowbacteria bacterium]
MSNEQNHVWITYPGHEGEFELSRDPDGTYWLRVVNGWDTSGQWLERNICDGRIRYRQVAVDQHGKALNEPPKTTQPTFKIPDVLLSREQIVA